MPLITHCLEQARDDKKKIEDFDQELARAAARIMVLGGSLPASGKLAATRAEREVLVGEIEEQLAKIQQTGCVVKDLNEGLVDFPALREGQEVYLCWKLGEERIGYWHGIEEGFAGRKPLDDVAPDEPPPGRGSLQ